MGVRTYNIEKSDRPKGTNLADLAWYFGVSRQRIDQVVHPERTAAHKTLNSALYKGLLVRPWECEGCEKQGKTAAHHEDYGYPLDVRWYCRRCHYNVHLKTQPVRFAVKELPQLMKQRQQERNRQLNNRVVGIRRCVDCGVPRKITYNYMKQITALELKAPRCSPCHMKQANKKQK